MAGLGRQRPHRRFRTAPAPVAMIAIGVIVGASAWLLSPASTFVPVQRGASSQGLGNHISRGKAASDAWAAAGASATVAASLLPLPAFADEDMGAVYYDEIKPMGILEGAEKKSEKWAFTVRAATDAFVSGDFQQTSNIISDYSSESWAWFVERITLGDPPWEEIGYFFLLLVVLANSAQFFIIIVEPLLASGSQDVKAPTTDSASRAAKREKFQQGRMNTGRSRGLELPPKKTDDKVPEEVMDDAAQRASLARDQLGSLTDMLKSEDIGLKKPSPPTPAERAPTTKEEVKAAKERMDAAKEAIDSLPKPDMRGMKGLPKPGGPGLL